jgi:hypothetical protein
MEKRSCSIHQMEANRSNAEKSTGPVSESGKRASSRNALRHALTGHTLAMRYDESEADYQQLLQNLRDEYTPDSTTEEILVVKLAQCYWLSQRAIRIASADMGDAAQVSLMLRYQAHHDRAFQSTLKQLIALQQLRASQAREEHLMKASAMSIDLEAKCIRLNMLREKQSAFYARQEDLAFRQNLKREIDSLTEGLSFDNGDEQPDNLAA